MRIDTHHFYKKVIVFLLAALVCLPCTVKREIKQAFDIPVAQLNFFEKANKATLCPMGVQDNSSKISIAATKKLAASHYPTIAGNFCREKYLSCLMPPGQREQKTDIVPIYILHEQYLI